MVSLLKLTCKEEPFCLHVTNVFVGFGFSCRICTVPPQLFIQCHHFYFHQLVAGQPHLVRGLREEEEVPCDRGGQQAATGGPRGPEAPCPERHQLHLRPYLGCLLHSSRGTCTRWSLSRQRWGFIFLPKMTPYLLIMLWSSTSKKGVEGVPWCSRSAGQRLRHVPGGDVTDSSGGQSL